jgi:hypothetical protein
MHKRLMSGAGGRRRDVPVLAAALTAALAGADPAAASPGGAGARGAPGAGVISTVTGGVGGPAKATKVALGFPCGVSFGAGHLYVANGSFGPSEVRQVDPGTDGLTAPEGTGVPGPLGDGGPATQASLGTCGAVPDHSRNLVISDTTNNRVRVAAAATGTFYGQAMTAGHIYTVAGNGQFGFSCDGGPARDLLWRGDDGRERLHRGRQRCRGLCR